MSPLLGISTFFLVGLTSVFSSLNPNEHVPKAAGLAPQRRANKPITYAGAVCNGNAIAQLVAEGGQPQSSFTDYNAISSNYKLYSPALFVGDGTLNAAFAAIGVSSNNFKRWGGEYAPPDGTAAVSFNLWINVHDGMIIVDYAQSAERGAQIPAGVPTRLSDIMYLVWTNVYNTLQPKADPKSLKYILHRSVTNQYSQAISTTAIKNAKSKLAEWPGTKLDPDTDPWAAIVGCPNGYGVAFMLAQHEETFRSKSLSTAWVFENTTEELCFLYSLADSGNAARGVSGEMGNGSMAVVPKMRQ